MKRILLATAIAAMVPFSAFAQTPPQKPPPGIPTPVPVFVSPVRLINAPNIENNTRAVLKCKPNEIIMSAVCNNHLAPTPGSTKGPETPAIYINQTTAECKGASLNQSPVALCANYDMAQPSEK